MRLLCSAAEKNGTTHGTTTCGDYRLTEVLLKILTKRIFKAALSRFFSQFAALAANGLEVSKSEVMVLYKL